MREIKFRDYEPNLKQMRYFDLDGYDKQEHDAYGNIMQFTGLNDKNGKAIYEGDIIKRVTIFEDGGCDVHLGILRHNELESSYYLHSIKNELSRSFGKPSKNTTYEVIGNIHENPELL